MLVIFSWVFIGSTEATAVTHRGAPCSLFARGKQTYQLENDRRKEAAREIDFPAAVSDPLSFNLSFPFLIAPTTTHTHTHTCVLMGHWLCSGGQIKTHCLSASLGQYIHLVAVSVSLYLCKWLFMGRRSLLFSPHWSVFTWWERQVLQGQRGREWNDYGKCKQTLGEQQEKMLHKRLRFIREHWCYCAAVIRTTLQTLQSTEPPVRAWSTKLMQINESWWLSTIKQTPVLQ